VSKCDGRLFHFDDLGTEFIDDPVCRRPAAVVGIRTSGAAHHQRQRGEYEVADVLAAPRAESGHDVTDGVMTMMHGQG